MQALVSTEWRELLDVLDDFIYLTDELEDLDITGIVHSHANVYFLVLNNLQWEEGIDYILHKKLMVKISLYSTLPSLFLGKLEGFSYH